MTTSNISTYDKLMGRVSMLRKYPNALNCYRKAYTNYINVLMRSVKGSYPIQAKLRNGEIVILNTEREAWYYMLKSINLVHGKSFTLKLDMQKDEAEVLSKDDEHLASIKSFLNNGDLWGVFIKDEYDLLDVKGRTVVDIGCNIGDSSIYFALRGAKKIVALEPFYSNYQIAMENIQVNNLEEKIKLKLAGCSGKKGIINIDNENKSNSLSELIEVNGGQEVPILTLEDILDEYSVGSGSILKMDCEGCEYASILESSSQILGNFSQIVIEYHQGYLNLVKRLKSIGFHVAVTRPSRWKQRGSGKVLYTGMIYATLSSSLV